MGAISGSQKFIGALWRAPSDMAATPMYPMYASFQGHCGSMTGVCGDNLL
ncbi:MAG TPA: hypothetical protein VHZ07_21260 [Bryobacteraceae bacterium]|nr:hypothetical protein [Bryobacteraceae bacterium]